MGKSRKRSSKIARTNSNRRERRDKPLGYLIFEDYKTLQDAINEGKFCCCTGQKVYIESCKAEHNLITEPNECPKCAPMVD